jgi:LysR family nitrogen assimilation transcriptional regulator
MRFKQIQHFVHVVETGSLSKAAERLHIVQPALTQSIKRLESELECVLFTRSRRGMELTDAGQVFLKHAYGILNQYNRAKESVSTTQDDPQGSVSVAMTASALRVLTVPVCQALTESYPKIRLNIEAGLAGNIQQGFEAGQYDLVLSYLSNPNPSIHIENLIEEDLFLTTAFDPQNEGFNIEFKELDELPLIIPHDQHGVGPSLTQHAKQNNVNIRTAYVTGSLNPTLQLVENDFGSSLLPWSAIYDRVSEGRLSARKVVSPSLSHTVSMVYPTNRPLTPATIAVMTIIKKAAKRVHNEGNWSGQLLI